MTKEEYKTSDDKQYCYAQTYGAKEGRLQNARIWSRKLGAAVAPRSVEPLPLDCVQRVHHVQPWHDQAAQLQMPISAAVPACSENVFQRVCVRRRTIRFDRTGQ